MNGRVHSRLVTNRIEEHEAAAVHVGLSCVHSVIRRDRVDELHPGQNVSYADGGATTNVGI